MTLLSTFFNNISTLFFQPSGVNEDLKIEKKDLIRESNYAWRSKSQINIGLIKHKYGVFEIKLTQEKKPFTVKKLWNLKMFNKILGTL